MMMSVIPESTASSMTYWMTGLSTSGSISFGCAFVAGRNRVPRPAAGKTAFRIGDVLEFFAIGLSGLRGVADRLWKDAHYTRLAALLSSERPCARSRPRPREHRPRQEEARHALGLVRSRPVPRARRRAAPAPEGIGIAEAAEESGQRGGREAEARGIGR